MFTKYLTKIDTMNTQADYLFTSARLGFRDWAETDLDAFAAMNADADVMEFFPEMLTHEQSLKFMQRLSQQLAKNNYTYFAVDTLEDGQFIGFIGLHEQTYEAPFTPCVDIGWRLTKAAWGKGYATEGAKRCLEYAFETLGLEQIYSIASVINVKSIRVMEKIGMQKKVATFEHPKLKDCERLRECVLYEVLNENF